MDFAKITGKNLEGEKREYLFKLMDAFEGTKLFHEYLDRLFTLISKVGELFEETEDGINFKVGEGMKLIKEILPWEKIEELSKALLVGCEIRVDGKKFMNDSENGIGDFFRGRPREVYTAIFYGLCANFEDEMRPFMEALGINEDDSSQ
jgi:hypothetical protein